MSSERSSSALAGGGPRRRPRRGVRSAPADRCGRADLEQRRPPRARASSETFTPPIVTVDRRGGDRDPALPAQRPDRRDRTRDAARAGRGRRALAGVRMPDGHLPHVHVPQGRGRGAQRPDRRASPTRRTRTSSCACRSPPATSRSRSERLHTEKRDRETRTCPPHSHSSRRTRSRRSATSSTSCATACVADLGERDAAYIRRMIQAQRALEVVGPRLAVRRGAAAGVARRRHRAGAVEDPRQHGDRPQRDARPVRLDEGSGAGLQAVRVGHRLPRRPVAPLPQLHAPHAHERARQGSRHRLRRAADVRGAAVASARSSATRCTRRCWRCCSSGAWPSTTSRSSGSRPARSTGTRSGTSSARSGGRAVARC